MIILASKPQIWPCFAVGSSVSRDGAALPSLRSLSAARLVGSGSQVHNMDDTVNVVTRGQLGSDEVDGIFFNVEMAWV